MLVFKGGYYSRKYGSLYVTCTCVVQSEDEVEEMPKAAKLRMRNIGK